MMDVGERKIPRPIGTERAAMSRRTPGPPPSGGVGFSPDLWGFHPGAEMGAGAGPMAPPMSMNPSSLPPNLSHADWMPMPGFNGPNVSVPAPHASDESGLLYVQKQQAGMAHHHHHHHHALLQRQMDGMMSEGGESLEMQFAGGMNGGAAPGANAGSFHHPGAAFMNGIPPPGMPGGPMAAQLFPGGQAGPGEQHAPADAMNGMWIAPGSNLKGKVGGPSPGSVMGEQQVPDSGMVSCVITPKPSNRSTNLASLSQMWMKWSQQ